MRSTGWGLAWMITAPAVSVLLLISVAVLRFAVDTDGIMLLAVIPIALLGMQFGRVGGLAAALFSSTALIVWSFSEPGAGTVEQVNQALTFLVLGFMAGTWAHGTLGNYDPESLVMIWRVRNAARRGRLVMHYQPIVGARKRNLIALEALVRCVDQNRETMLPGSFLPLIERNKQATWAMTLHTLDVAIRDATGWTDKDFSVAVNISPLILQRPELPEAIAEALEKHGLAPERLAIEVTENVVATDETQLITTIEGLRSIGVNMIAIDDFGVGQSSLARLDRLPIDVLKIDRSLVSRIDHAQTRAIIAAITDLGHALQLRVVGEGAENAAILESLVALGCDAVQGFGIAPPLPPEELDEWMSRDQRAHGEGKS